MINSKKLSLYIHIPFCVKKCYYCDFLSAPADEKMKSMYVKALIRELTLKAQEYMEYEIDTIFFGGGTPSTLAVSLMEALMSSIKEQYHIRKDAEISIEMNPGTVNMDNLIRYRAAGFNRLSIGMQSANDAELKALGRIHTYAAFQEIYQAARTAGFHNINIDIMSALPGQTMESYEDTLQKVIALNPEHISSYSLIIEEETPFWKIYGDDKKDTVSDERKEYPSLPEEELEREMYVRTDELLRKNGYHRYEISNYAKEGYECKHNTGYWTRHEYLGLGLGASSLVQNHRWKNESDLTDYVRMYTTESKDSMLHQERKQEEILTREEQMEEFMFLGLRLMKGVSYQIFENIFSISMKKVYKDQIEKLMRNHLLRETEDGRLCLTDRGIDISNSVMAEFLF